MLGLDPKVLIECIIIENLGCRENKENQIKIVNLEISMFLIRDLTIKDFDSS